MSSAPVSKRRGTGAYAKGQARVDGILDAARTVFVTQGYGRLTMRRVAAEAGITVGNLYYYYHTKKDLLRDLLDHVIEGYVQEFDRIRARVGRAPDAELQAICEYIISDLNKLSTTRFFPELWALANHDPYAAALMDRLYSTARIVLNDLIEALNPSLTTRERECLALFISASMEGLTMFVGYDKPWAGSLPRIRALAVRSFVRLARETKGTRRTARRTAGPHRSRRRAPARGGS